MKMRAEQDIRNVISNAIQHGSSIDVMQHSGGKQLNCSPISQYGSYDGDDGSSAAPHAQTMRLIRTLAVC